MSAISHRQDRAYCANSGSSPLRRGRLYCVAAVRMSPFGGQSLNLVGLPDKWFISTRFIHIPDPSPRQWPQST